MNQLYKDLIETFITVGIPAIVGAVIAAVKHFIGAQKLSKLASVINTKNVLAQDAVKFVEDAFAELHGAEKLESAKKNLIGRLNQYGIAVTEDEADTLIRSAFQSVKDRFVSETAKEITA